MAPQEGQAPETGRYHVHLDIFDGPLDLLLHLVQKHELDIFDIPIAFIADEYLRYLDMMRQMNLEIASDYLLMAATLAHIKSREMLPRRTDEDEDAVLDPEEDPRIALARRLLEYQKYKEAARRLADRPLLGSETWTRPVPPPQRRESELRPVGIMALLEAFARLMANLSDEPQHDVVVERITISSRLTEVLDILRGRGKMTLSNCLKQVLGGTARDPRLVRAELVVTFLAILEIARLGLARVYQAGRDSEIYLVVDEADDENERPHD